GVLDNYLDLLAREDAAAGADGRAERHDRRAAYLFQPPGEHRIGVDVWQDGEALIDQALGGFQRADGIGQEVFGVRDDLQLYPTGAGQLAGKPSGEDRLVGCTAARSVGENRV